MWLVVRLDAWLRRVVTAAGGRGSVGSDNDGCVCVGDGEDYDGGV